jgi:hypothetical protein
MRKAMLFTALAVFLSGFSMTSTSCSRKVGCPANEAAHVKPGRNGELPTSGGRTQLFPSDFNKKKKRRRKN